MLECVYFLFLATTLVNAKPVDVGLYGFEDNVTILTGENFNQTIFNSQYIWMVEFYSSWCGHCQAFAPTFKAFAKDIAEWQHIFRLAVINCPDETNRPICTDLKVRGYPEMRVFHPFSNHKSAGIIVHGDTIKELLRVSLNSVELQLRNLTWNLDGVQKPTFKFASYNDITRFFEMKVASHYLAVVIEDRLSDMGKKIILDMSSCKNITTRRFNSNSPDLRKLESRVGVSLNNFPTVILLMKDGKAREIEVKFRDRSFYTYQLQRMPGVGDPKLLPKQLLSFDDESKSYVNWTTVDRRKVYMADIEAGLRYALTVEIGSVKVLQDETLDAAKTFIGTLALLSERLPVRGTTKKFIVKLTAWLAGMTKIDHVIWQQRVEVIEADNYLPPVKQKWVGCAPSKPIFRGYPCSLWTLFHALTAASYNKNEQDFEKVPQAMEAYILNFFGCIECRKNFITELIESPYEEILKSNKDAILWLWELHNKVNKRLHGTVSEDPNFPKLQFPSVEFCPDCQNAEGKWNRDNVFDYLLERYSMGSVSEEFLEKAEKPVETQMGVFQPHDRDESYEQFGENLEIHARFDENDFDAGDRNYDNAGNELPGGGHPQLVKEFLNSKRKHHSLDVLREFGGDEEDKLQYSWHNAGQQSGFTYFDTSFCFLLWAISMFIVGLLYFYIRKRRMPKYCKV